MKISTFLLGVFILFYNISFSQNSNSFPREEISASVKNAFENSKCQNQPVDKSVKPTDNSGAYHILNKISELKNKNWNSYVHSPINPLILDTVIVGAVPQDTLTITGTYTHTGPIFVLGDGVLIIHNSNFTNYGDIYAFQNGTILADSSSLTFPQQYFYERSLIVVQHGTVSFNTCLFNYSGIQHNLVLGDTSVSTFINTHQNDWTTCGLFGNAVLHIDGLNLGGEFILDDRSTATFKNVDTLLLWHKIPNTAVINFTFPQGDTVPNYVFNNSVTGVSGLDYSVTVDTCHTVWWAMMPVNGSDVRIVNSNIRAIGTWFQHGDSLTVSGIYDNTYYPNTLIPLPDRTLRLLNSFVQTWSLYVFDSSQVNILSGAYGEVGTQQRSKVLSQNFLLDGSGGYFWATDSSVIFASNITIYSTARSERNGIFVLSYSNLPFSPVSSISKSLFISVQNIMPVDPVPYDGSSMWFENIETAPVVHTDSVIPLKGSAWIDQGPQGSWMFFNSYSLYYQKQGSSVLFPIVVDSALEIRHSALADWNTAGLDSGNYVLHLFVKNMFGDSVEDIKNITLLLSPPSVIQPNEERTDDFVVSIFPNPATDFLIIELPDDHSSAEIKLIDLLGETVLLAQSENKKARIHLPELTQGVYMIEIRSRNKTFREKIVIE